MDDVAHLEQVIDLLEQNARVQAKLLADTGRQRDELVKALKQIRIVCHDNAATTVRHDLALEFVAGVAVKALDDVGGEKL